MTLVCNESGCPLATDGRCLEQFEDPGECPHTTEVDEPTAAVAAAPDVDSETSESVGEPTPEAPEGVDLGGDESLSLTEADVVAARYGATVVLVGGAFASGKTSLVAGLYALFLDRPAGEWSFAGATSLVALDRRYHGKRASSGLSQPSVARTRDEDMRLLDLRLAREGRVVNLMFSDVRGEYFEAVVGGQPVAEVVSLAARSDVAIVVLDGSRLGDRFARNSEVHFARQLIAGLTEPGGVRPGLPLGLVVSKLDELGSGADEWVAEQLDALEAFAAERGFGSVERHMTAAFAKAGAEEHQGMRELLQWVAADRTTPVEVAQPADPPDVRSYLRGVPGG